MKVSCWGKDMGIILNLVYFIASKPSFPCSIYTERIDFTCQRIGLLVVKQSINMVHVDKTPDAANKVGKNIYDTVLTNKVYTWNNYKSGVNTNQWGLSWVHTTLNWYLVLPRKIESIKTGIICHLKCSFKLVKSCNDPCPGIRVLSKLHSVCRPI